MDIIFRKKFKAFGSLPPPKISFCLGRSETQTVKLEAHSAQIKNNLYHFQPKILNEGGGGAGKCTHMKLPTHGFSDTNICTCTD